MNDIASISPQRPSDVVGSWIDVGAQGVDTAIRRARAAASWWGATTAFDRSTALHQAADRLEGGAAPLVELIIREVGKPRQEAVAEVARAVAILRYYSGAALDADGETFPSVDGRTWLISRRRPRGVVALITPWNFPVAIPVWKLAPALAWGNVAILKAAREALATAHQLVETLGLPKDVLQIVATGTEGARALSRHPDLDALSFTGSAAVGRELAVATAETGIPLQAELGGSNPSLVLPDADVEAAALAIALGAMAFAGQKCTATRRVVCVGDGGAFRDALLAAVHRLPVGDPADATTLVGPVISESARRGTLDAIAASKADGGRVLCGGSSIAGSGFLLEPTVVDRLATTSLLGCEEVFGPLMAVFYVRDVEEAVRVANATQYGLVASVHTKDLGAAMDIAHRLEAGMVRVNASTTGVDFHAPFGGEKASSRGPREQGRAALEFYTTRVTLSISPPSQSSQGQ